VLRASLIEGFESSSRSRDLAPARNDRLRWRSARPPRRLAPAIPTGSAPPKKPRTGPPTPYGPSHG